MSNGPSMHGLKTPAAPAVALQQPEAPTPAPAPQPTPEAPPTPPVDSHRFSLWEAWQEVTARHAMQSFLANVIIAILALTTYSQHPSFYVAALAGVFFFGYRWYATGNHGSTKAKIERRARVAVYLFTTAAMLAPLAIILYYFRGGM